MKSSRHYLQLRKHYGGLSGLNEVDATLDELAAILDCTHRNVVLLLKKMSSEGWIKWTPKRGRGNRSTLLFLRGSDEMALQIARDLVEKRDLRGALEQLNAAGVTPAGKAGFNEWLLGNFGYQSELRDSKKIDTLRFPLQQPVHTLDPVYTDYTTESHLVGQLFDSLVRLHPLTRAAEPHLAHAWETDRDGCGWTFYLRKGVLFHHGREMDASDVSYSLDRIRQARTRSLYRWVHESIERIEVLDPTTVHVRLRERNELFLPFLATSRTSVVPQDVYGMSERYAGLPVGSGPFKLVRNDGSVCVLEAFPYYFHGRAHLDRVEIWNIPDLYESERLDRFQVMHNVRLPDDQTKTWQQVKQQGATCKFITFNLLKQGPLSDPEIRKAVCRAIDRDRIMDALAGDAIVQAEGFVFDRGATATDTFVEDVELDRFDVEKGATIGEATKGWDAWERRGEAAGDGDAVETDTEAVEEAGGGDALERNVDPAMRQTRGTERVADDCGGEWGGEKIGQKNEDPGRFSEGITLELCTIPQYKADAKIVQAVLREAGIALRVTLLPLEQFQGERRLQADLLLFAVMLDHDAELRLIDLYKSMRHHLDPELAAMLESSLAAITQEPSRIRRRAMLGELENRLKLHHAIVFLYLKHLKTAFHPAVKGISLDSLGWVQFKDIWYAR